MFQDCVFVQAGHAPADKAIAVAFPGLIAKAAPPDAALVVKLAAET